MAALPNASPLRISVKSSGIPVALDDEVRGPVVLADHRDGHRQCERVVFVVLGQYDEVLTFVEPYHQHAAVVANGADDERRRHVMFVEELLDNRRQELLKARVHLLTLSVERDDLATEFCALA
jgi:hypothetical protein